ncbi:MAG: outer membrane beta-barrel domain-containing protein [Bdellovibrionota bacterium]
MLLVTYLLFMITISNSSAEDEAQQVNIDAIKEKYWARGNETELGVVQNRLYSKESKLEIGSLVGVLSTDPFLSVKCLGIKAGFHFSEYFAANILAWKNFVEPSSALLTFQETVGATTNNNPQRSFIGTELAASLIYGKLSLIGKAIIYYDLHLSAGGGVTATESGNYFTPLIGIGQQIFLSQSVSLRVDYRAMRYTETIIEKVITPKLGQPIGQRVNWTNAVTLGLDFLFGL